MFVCFHFIVPSSHLLSHLCPIFVPPLSHLRQPVPARSFGPRASPLSKSSFFFSTMSSIVQKLISGIRQLDRDIVEGVEKDSVAQIPEWKNDMVS
jgi:hypothetical protein